jgi:hypothetical protein
MNENSQFTAAMVPVSVTRGALNLHSTDGGGLCTSALALRTSRTLRIDSSGVQHLEEHYVPQIKVPDM